MKVRKYLDKKLEGYRCKCGKFMAITFEDFMTHVEEEHKEFERYQMWLQ